MTVSSTVDRASFAGNGVASVFPLPFRFLADSDIVARLIEDATETVTVLSLGVDYTLFGAGEPDGTDGNPVSELTMTVPPATGYTLAVQRQMQAVQPTDFINQGRFYPEMHENSFDRVTMLIQQSIGQLGRALVKPDGLNYYDADGAPIRNLPDPETDDAAVNRGWMQSYLNSLIGSGVVPNSAANVLYIRPDGVMDNLQSLSSTTGADLIAFGTNTLGDLFRSTAGKGDALIPVLQPYTGAIVRSQHEKNSDYVSLLDFLQPGAATVNTALQAAIDTRKAVHVPAGVYTLDAVTGIKLRDGTTIFGDGSNRTIFVCNPGGGTTSQLRNYGPGRAFGRDMNMSGTNTPINDVLLQDFAVMTQHPPTSYTTDAIQIAIDFRSISGSTCLRVHAGNIPPVNGPVPAPAISKTYLVQGYGFVAGSESGQTYYAGGERNMFIACKAYGSYHNITIDDETLSPISAAYTTIVDSCDIQTGHVLLQQASQYGAGCSFERNILQDVRRNTGVGAVPTQVLIISGYQNYARTHYVEAGSACDRIVTLGSQSKSNQVIFQLASSTSAATFNDTGTQNRLEYLKDDGTIPGGYKSGGRPITLYNGQEEKIWCSFVGATPAGFTGAGILSITRNGVGDYTIFFERNYKNLNDYATSYSMQTDASVNQGNIVTRTYSVSQIRIVTYINNVQADPLRVNVTLTLR